MLTIDQLLSVVDIATGIQHHTWRIGSNSHLYGTIRQSAEQIRGVICVIQKESVIVALIAPDLNVFRILLKLCRQRNWLAEVKRRTGYVSSLFWDKVWSVADITVSVDLKKMISGRAGKVTGQIKVTVVGNIKISILIGDGFIIHGKLMGFCQGISNGDPPITRKTIQSVRKIAGETYLCITRGSD